MDIRNVGVKLVPKLRRFLKAFLYQKRMAEVTGLPP
jgi:hypothetical protein